jgi:hypothetical protein
MDSPLVYRYAASVDDILEEEEHYADQLKEYLFYTEALRYSIPTEHQDCCCRPSKYHFINPIVNQDTERSLCQITSHCVLGCACYGS